MNIDRFVFEKYQILLYVIRQNKYMCITFFCSQPSKGKGLSFVLGFNREESTQRQTLKLAPFQEDPNIYGGRDVQSGGSWLGLNIQTGLLVILTNYVMPPPYKRVGISRGKVVSHFLRTSFIPKNKIDLVEDTILEELRQLSKSSQHYSPFNLVVANLRLGNLYYICSQNPSIGPILYKQRAYGLSNSDIETVWKKTERGLSLFTNLLQQIDQYNEQQSLLKLQWLMQDKLKLQVDNAELASIFIEPYWNEKLRVERRTKSTTLILVSGKQEKKYVVLKQITYSNNAEDSAKEEAVMFRLFI